MGKKRKRTSNPGGPDVPKRHHSSYTYDNDDDGTSTPFKAARGYIDPTTGQRGAFPGFEDSGDDFFCGPALDGMDYLRMVRSEARGVPSLLVANPTPVERTPPPEYLECEDYELEPDAAEEDYTGVGDVVYDVFDYALEDGEIEDQEAEAEVEAEDTRGWYEDGTYIAAGVASYPQRPPSPTKIPLLTWHASFMTRFRRLRTALHSSHPLSIGSTSSASNNSVSASRPIPHKQEDWLDLLYNTSPTPTYLWKFDQHTILKGFKINIDLLKVGADTPINQTRWIYAMLLKCSEVMTPEEVCIVRDLGKRAVTIQKKLEASGCFAPRENKEEKVGSGEAGGKDEKERKDGEEKEEYEVQQQSNGEGEGTSENGDIAEDEEQEEGHIERSSKDDPSPSGNMPQEAGAPASAAELSHLHEPLLKSNPDPLSASKPLAEPALTHSSAITAEPIPTNQRAPSPIPPLPRTPSSANPSNTTNPANAPACPNTIATQRIQKRRKNRKPKSGKYDYIPSPNTLSTLDMIISIVGDFFGQRDLLEERRFHGFRGGWGTGMGKREGKGREEEQCPRLDHEAGNKILASLDYLLFFAPLKAWGLVCMTGKVK
ncbi:hypothetical protein BDZ91DRAFT_853132 [Kalaharituber pfeilii]|nr:hypothetical protein BDZ91DRAFT_853132 [Kalaharituber pfeilii]